MDFDELRPTGYFSEFSWYSYEEDSPPYSPFVPGDYVQMLVASGEAQERSDAEARRERQDNQED